MKMLCSATLMHLLSQSPFSFSLKSYFFRQWQFFKKTQWGRGTEFLSILEVAEWMRTYVSIFQLHVFYMKKVYPFFYKSQYILGSAWLFLIFNNL